ncbi:MAG: lipase/acyltransferase domain-containing protein [Gammaproteobacteria bacterium]
MRNDKSSNLLTARTNLSHLASHALSTVRYIIVNYRPGYCQRSGVRPNTRVNAMPLRLERWRGEEQQSPQDNLHRRGKYEIIKKFIDAVLAYTGSATVDFVAHSLGVSMAITTLEANDAWAGIRRFVNIAGGIRGLNSCLYVGPANPVVATCGFAKHLRSLRVRLLSLLQSLDRLRGRT